MTLVLRRLLPARGRRSGWPLLWPQLLLVLLVTLITGATVVSYDRMVRHNAEQQMQNTADLGEVFLNQRNAGVATVIASTMTAGDVSEALQAPGTVRSKRVIQRTLGILSASGPNISSVLITDGAGRVISAVPEILPVGTDLSRSPWFQLVRGNDAFSVAPVFESVVKGRYLTAISVPVRLTAIPKDRLLGVVVVTQKLDGYQRFVDVYAKNRNIRLSVLDGAGALVASGGSGALPVNTSVAARLAAGRALMSKNSPGQITALSVDTGAQGASGDPGGDWRVVSQVPTGVAMHPAVFFRAVAGSAGALILIATFLITWIRRRASRADRDATHRLAQSESRMHDLANASQNLLFRLNPDGTTIFASLASELILGQTGERLLGTDLLSRVMAETAPSSQDRLQALIRDGEPRSFLARTTGAGGVRRFVECGLRLGQSEEVSEVWGSLHDVTDHRSASDQVEQLFQLSEDFMAVLDFDGRLVQTNPVWTAVFGVSQEQLLGTRFEKSFQPEDHESVNIELARLAAVPSVATFETRYLRAGAIRTLLWTAGPDPDRKLIYAVGRDITDQKELQRALAHTRDQALEASRLKSEFVATMSHEIRTPMNGVIGLTDLLLGSALDATQRRYVEGVRIAGDALLSVINDILDFSKIEAGRMVLDSIDFRLEDVVEDVATLVRPAANAKNLELTVEFRPGVPFALNGDPGRLRQILLNLTHNAVKFTERGGVSVWVEPGPARSDGQVPVIFNVIDTGIGMDSSQLEELFEPFRQAHQGPSRAYGGTGLGLSICRRLADLMGGEIHASSELGQGATFVAELLFAPAADWGRSVRGPDARGLAVLVVDDDQVNRLVMFTQLSRWGMRPVPASSAAEALELLTLRSAPAGGYDLAVIGMHRPDTDGLALVRQLRAIPALRRLPVILLASDETIPAETALEYRISARLTRPVQQSDLFDALTRVALPTAFAGTSVTGAGRPGARPAPDPAVAPGVAPVTAPTAVGTAGPEIVRPEIAQSSALPGSSRRPAPSPPSGPDGPFQLLLVEDNDINQTVALGILTQLGYQVDVAGDGIQAVTMAGQHAYDAILMDCQMPRLDGYAATMQLRKGPATRSTPIIAMTAATFAADRQRCFDSGMDDFIAKPVRAATLQATLNRWLRPDPPSLAPEQLVLESAGPMDAEEVAALPAPRTPEIIETAGTEERIQELLGDGSQLAIDMVRDIITSFLSRTVDLLQRLTLAVAANDAPSVHLHAHSMAGAGLNLGTMRVVTISRQIEADAKSGRPALSVPRLVELEVALEQARVVLRDIAVNLPGADPYAASESTPADPG